MIKVHDYITKMKTNNIQIKLIRNINEYNNSDK